MKTFRTISRLLPSLITSEDERVERATAAGIGAIDLRPRIQVHTDALGNILDRLETDRQNERNKQARLREQLDDSVTAECEIDRLIKAYSGARETLA